MKEYSDHILHGIGKEISVIRHQIQYSTLALSVLIFTECSTPTIDHSWWGVGG